MMRQNKGGVVISDSIDFDPFARFVNEPFIAKVQLFDGLKQTLGIISYAFCNTASDYDNDNSVIDETVVQKLQDIWMIGNKYATEDEAYAYNGEEIVQKIKWDKKHMFSVQAYGLLCKLAEVQQELNSSNIEGTFGAFKTTIEAEVEAIRKNDKNALHRLEADLNIAQQKDKTMNMDGFKKDVLRLGDKQLERYQQLVNVQTNLQNIVDDVVGMLAQLMPEGANHPDMIKYGLIRRPQSDKEPLPPRTSYVGQLVFEKKNMQNNTVSTTYLATALTALVEDTSDQARGIFQDSLVSSLEKNGFYHEDEAAADVTMATNEQLGKLVWFQRHDIVTDAYVGLACHALSLAIDTIMYSDDDDDPVIEVKEYIDGDEDIVVAYQDDRVDDDDDDEEVVDRSKAAVRYRSIRRKLEIEIAPTLGAYASRLRTPRLRLRLLEYWRYHHAQITAMMDRLEAAMKRRKDDIEPKTTMIDPSKFRAIIEPVAICIHDEAIGYLRSVWEENHTIDKDIFQEMQDQSMFPTPEDRVDTTTDDEAVKILAYQRTDAVFTIAEGLRILGVYCHTDITSGSKRVKMAGLKQMAASVVEPDVYRSLLVVYEKLMAVVRVCMTDDATLPQSEYYDLQVPHMKVAADDEADDPYGPLIDYFQSNGKDVFGYDEETTELVEFTLLHENPKEYDDEVNLTMRVCNAVSLLTAVAEYAYHLIDMPRLVRTIFDPDVDGTIILNTGWKIPTLDLRSIRMRDDADDWLTAIENAYNERSIDTTKWNTAVDALVEKVIGAVSDKAGRPDLRAQIRQAYEAEYDISEAGPAPADGDELGTLDMYARHDVFQDSRVGLTCKMLADALDDILSAAAATGAQASAKPGRAEGRMKRLRTELNGLKDSLRGHYHTLCRQLLGARARMGEYDDLDNHFRHQRFQGLYAIARTLRALGLAGAETNKIGALTDELEEGDPLVNVVAVAVYRADIQAKGAEDAGWLYHSLQLALGVTKQRKAFPIVRCAVPRDLAAAAPQLASYFAGENLEQRPNYENVPTAAFALVRNDTKTAKTNRDAVQFANLINEWVLMFTAVNYVQQFCPEQAAVDGITNSLLQPDSPYAGLDLSGLRDELATPEQRAELLAAIQAGVTAEDNAVVSHDVPLLWSAMADINARIAATVEETAPAVAEEIRRQFQPVGTSVFACV